MLGFLANVLGAAFELEGSSWAARTTFVDDTLLLSDTLADLTLRLGPAPA